MNTTEIKIKLHEEIEHSDEKLLKIIYAIVQEYNETDMIDDERMQLVEAERQRHLKGESRSYTWDEVKNMTRNEQRPDGL